MAPVCDNGVHMFSVHVYIYTCALNSDFGPAFLQMIGYLNFQLWTGVEGELVDDLRMDRRFPHQPTVSGCMLS